MKHVRNILFIIILGFVISSCSLFPETPAVEEAPAEPETDPPPTEELPLQEDTPARPTKAEPSTEEAVTDVPVETPEIPDMPLSDEGPWLIFSTPEGLFVMNPDGSGLTQFYFGPINSPWARQILISPHGGYLAYLVGESYDATLRINQFPWRTLITETPLLSYSDELDMDAMRAIVEQQSMAFSPDGQSLAFMGAMEGPTSDLYTYSLETYQITQLTDGPSQAHQPVWSPDGKYIVHTGVSSFGTGAGSTMSGVWASIVETTDAVTLYDPSGSGSERIIGWVDNQTFVVYSWDILCGSGNLRTFNIETQESSILWADSFRAAAFDPVNKVAVLISNDGECSPDSGAGLYHVPTNGNIPFRFLEFTGSQVIWSEEANLFLVSGVSGSGVIAVDSSGQFIDLDMPQGAEAFPAISPGTRDLAWSGDSLWIGALLGSIDNPPQEIFNEPVYTVTWTPDGESVIFFSDSGLYIAFQPDYTPILIAEGLDNRNGYSDWVSP